MSRGRILKSSSGLVFLTVLSRVLGLVREMIRAAFLGTTALADAFAIAFLIPNLLRRLFAEGTIAAAFIPVFKEILGDGDMKQTRAFLAATFTFGSLVFVITVVLGVLFARPLVRIFGPDLDPGVVDEAILLTRIMFPYLMFISISAFVQGVLNSLNVFAPSGFTPVLFNLCFIAAAYFLSPYTANPARALAIGVTAGGVVQILFQLPFMMNRGFRVMFTTAGRAFRHPGTRKVLRLIAPTVIGMGAYQINLLFATRIANSAGTGVVSSLQFSNRLLELLLGVFAVSLGTVILPELSQNARDEQWEKLSRNGVFVLRIIALVTVPSMFYTLLFRHEIVSLLFRTGAFGDRSVNLTAAALMFHILGLFFIAVNRILTPVFYAHQDTRSPTIAGVVTVFLNIVLAYTLVEPLAGGGVALAASIAAVVNMVLLFTMLSRKTRLGGDFIRGSLFYSLKILLFSVAALIPLLLVKPLLMNLFSGWNLRLIVFGGPLAGGAVVFFTALFLLLYVSGDSYIFELISVVKRSNTWKT